MRATDTTTRLIPLSCDVTTGNRSAASRPAHLIFGRADVRTEEVCPFNRRAGVVWIGQSVFVVPEPDSDELAEKLRCLEAIVKMARVAVDSVRFVDVRRRTLATRTP